MASRDKLEKAIELVQTKQLSLRVAAERYDIPKSTLYRHITGESKRLGSGRPTVLNAEEEKAIVRICQELAQSGFGLERVLVGCVISNYLKTIGRETSFSDGIPGKKWWQGFLTRWPQLSERKPQHFPSSRAMASTPEVMDNYFQALQVIHIELL